MPTRAVNFQPATNRPSFQPLPLALGRLAAGFPSPAEDHIESRVDLNEWLVERPAATFMVRIEGDSMIDAGIHDGNVAIVDRSIDPQPGHVVVAVVDGEFLVKRLIRQADRWLLACENPDYPATIPLDDAQDVAIWGVVRHVINTIQP